MTAQEKSSYSLEDLGYIARVLTRTSGITFREGLSKTLLNAFIAASADLGLGQDEFLRRLVTLDPGSVDALIERAVVSETYFFRHAEQFEALTSWVISELGHPSPLRMWCAGCATGEEPYSAAIALALRRREADQILATDISRASLARAQEGQYAGWSFRRVDPKIRAQYFREEAGGWRISDAIRRRVEFKQHNLIRDPPPATDFHVVCCRNVLIYFQGESLKRALMCLCAGLAPGGILIVSVPELPLVTDLPLERVEQDGVVVFRKISEAAKPARPAAPARKASPLRRPPSPTTRPSPSSNELKVVREAVSSAVTPPTSEAPPAGPEIRRGLLYEKACEAARVGDFARAEQLATEVAQSELCPEAFLLVAMAAESRGDLQGAVRAIRRALYLEPRLAIGHATLVVLYAKLGAAEEVERARRNALRLLEGVPEESILRAVEPMTAGTLRRALGERARG